MSYLDIGFTCQLFSQYVSLKPLRASDVRPGCGAMHEFRSLSMDRSRCTVRRGSNLLRTPSAKLACAITLDSQNKTNLLDVLQDELSYSVSVPQPTRFIVRSSSQQRSTLPPAFCDPHGEHYVRYENRCTARGFNQPSASFC